MNQTEKQGKSLDALKAFNNAIVTSRLYPQNAPQVANAIERGYKNIRSFLRYYGTLVFSFHNDQPWLCDQILGEEVLSLFPNLVVYRQLRILGFKKLCLINEMDRYAFAQILSVFNSSTEKIAEAGGGLNFITSRGLASYFPGGDNVSSSTSADKQLAGEDQLKKMVRVQRRLLSFLWGRSENTLTFDGVKRQFADKSVAIEVLAAGIGIILRDIQQEKKLLSANRFSEMFVRAERVIAEDSYGDVGLGLGKFLADSLKPSALCVLLCQEYPVGLAGAVYEGIIKFLPAERLHEVFVIFQQQITGIEKRGGDGEHAQLLNSSLRRLQQNRRVKQLLEAEKVCRLIRDGERLRRKKRLATGIQAILRGNVTAFKNEELLEYLPGLVKEMFETGQKENGVTVFKQMISYCSHDGEAIEKPLAKSIVGVADMFFAVAGWEMLAVAIDPLLALLRRAEEGDSSLERAVIILEQVMQKNWQDGDFAGGDKILNLFYQIRSGQISKNDSVKKIIALIQDRGVRPESFPDLLEKYLAQPVNKRVGYRLILQGPIAARFLVDRLINIDEYSERIKILDLLSYSGDYLPPIIIEKLAAHMPWYGKRNLIKLLGETGVGEDAKAVFPYLRHDDFRVQREAFLCIYKIGGKLRKQLLLLALDEASELTKIQIVSSLVGMCDSDCAVRLGELLAANSDFSERNRVTLLLQLLETLGKCRCPQALKDVQLFLNTRGGRSTKKLPQSVWAAAEKAQKNLEDDLQEIRKKHVQASKLRKNAIQEAMKRRHTEKVKQITEVPREQTIRQLVSKGETQRAVGMLLELIEKVACEKQFDMADKLRQWLIEIDPLAYSHIIQAAEIIDRERAAAIDKSHFEIWAGLYDILTTDEFSAVYYSLSHKILKEGEIIVNQGTLQPSLYFINSGKVKLYFKNQGNEVLVKTLTKGEIFGAAAFFEASVWTLSVASVGITDLSVLQRDKLKEWQEYFPGLETKLNDFSRNFESIEGFLERSAKDRRNNNRSKISGRVSAILIDSTGQNIGVSSSVELSDISQGGMSYLVRILRRENARLLLGRKVQIRLATEPRFKDVEPFVGDILAVRCIYAVESDYSVHICFEKSLTKEFIEDLVGREY